MNLHNTKGAIYNLLITLVAVLGAIALAVVTSTVTAKALLYFTAVATVVAVVSWIHMLLANNELKEQFELEEIQNTREGEGLFGDGEVLPRKQSREQFEKWGVPIAAVLMLGVQIWGLVLLAFNTVPEQFARIAEDKNAIIITSDQQILALIITALVGLILFIRGQFAANYSRIEKARLLQPASDTVLFSAYLFFAMAAMVAISFSDQRVDAYVGVALTVLLGFMALENLLGMIFEIYRPRMPERRTRLLYQSRLVGLIAKPENVFTTAGEVLNYQFGFKVSETWGYRFLRERLGALIGVQVLLLWISTSVVVVHPSEVGLKTNVLAADKEAAILEPGFHLKLPWPFASVDRYYPEQIHSFVVGAESAMDDAPTGVIAKLWEDRPWKDYDANRLSGRLYFMAGHSSDANGTALPNIVEASVPVQYRVPRDKLKNGWLNFQNPESLLHHVAYREVSAYFLENNLETLLRADNADSLKVKDRIQNALEEAGLGVEVLFVGLKGVRPPAETPVSIKGERDAEDNEAPGQNAQNSLSTISVGQAIETVHANRVAGKVSEKVARNSEEVAQYATRTGVAHHNRRKQDANATAVSQAQGKVSELEREAPLYKVSPELYQEWRYLHAFSEVVANARKFVIAVGPDVEVQIDLDLQESLRRELYQVPGTNNGNE